MLTKPTIVLVVVATLLSGCATPPPVELVALPTAGVVATTAVGEPMVRQFRAMKAVGFNLPYDEDVTGLLGGSYTVHAQDFVFDRKSKDGSWFAGTRGACQNALGVKCITDTRVAAFLPDDSTKPMELNVGNIVGHMYFRYRPTNANSEIYTSLGGNSFRKEFIFNGNAGGTAKFLYREYVNDLARPSFAQELQYDLSKDRIVGFRELKIEVLKTTNSDITYKVLSHFIEGNSGL